ncbi:cytochrome P450 [Favolaschia claudopus]|uniref:Cytochrome P450 n=1 Tax=Favolaschia claudopus TaxID=2862362 RepID=A0AAV9ZBF4_9AGAR
MASILSNLLLGLVGTGFVIALAKSTYIAFFSPLHRIPGPWYMAMSDFFLATHLMRFHQTPTIHKLIQKYGPVVRVGPNKVVFSNLEAMQSVYVQNKFPKNSGSYSHFRIDGVDHLFSMSDNESHAVRRRAIGSHYTSVVLHFQPQLYQLTLQLVNHLNLIGGRLPVDCLLLLRNYMVDVVVLSTFGFDLGAVQRWSINEPEPIADAIIDFTTCIILESFFPAFIWNALRFFPNARWRSFTGAASILKEFVRCRVNDLQQLGGVETHETITLVQCLLRHTKSLNPDTQLGAVVIPETVVHFIAGSETSAMTLTYMLWQLTRSPEVADKLQKELDEAIPDPHNIPDMAVLRTLPYLNAFIQEGLRLHGAVPPLLERVVPPGPNFQLMGYTIPPGTVIGTQSWSVHRDPEAFPLPEKFDPERWMAKIDSPCTSASHFMPFGLGTRVCVGQPLAQAAIRAVIVALARNFTITADENTTEASMTMVHGFVCF